MAEAITIQGPHQVFITAGETDYPIGLTPDGFRHIETVDHEEVVTDQYGSGTRANSAPAGVRYNVEFSLSEINRTNLEKLIAIDMVDGVGGVLPTIGRKASVCGDDGTNAMKLVFVKVDNGVLDRTYSIACPSQIIQRISSKHTTVDCRFNALPSTSDTPASRVFFVDTEAVDTSFVSAIEVCGSATCKWNANAIGHARDGFEITIDYTWEDVLTDLYGPRTPKEMIFQGMRVGVRPMGDIHSYDTAQSLLQEHLGGSATYLEKIGILNSTNAKVLLLDSDLAANGFDYTFNLAYPDGQPIQTRISALHSVLSIGWSCLHNGSKVFYTRATGS